MALVRDAINRETYCRWSREPRRIYGEPVLYNGEPQMMCNYVRPWAGSATPTGDDDE